MKRTVIALLADFDAAEQAVDRLRDAGFTKAEVSVVAQSDVVDERLGDDRDELVLGTAGEGLAGGALIGGLAGLLAGVAAVLLPGIGTVVATGAMGTLLGATAVGSGIGGAFGGLAGAFIGLGVSEEEAHLYVEGARRGYVLLAVETDDAREPKAMDAIRRAEPLQLASWSGSWETPAAVEQTKDDSRS